MNLTSTLEERLLRYVQVDTQSDAASPTVPSTAIQLDLLRMLEAELSGLGARDVKLTDSGFVIGTIPANVTGKVPTVAFLAHVDTTADFNGFGVKPIVHRKWMARRSCCPTTPRASRPGDQSRPGQRQGARTSSRLAARTLLGADDKAGVAEIMTLADHLLAHPEIKHGDIRVCFTPDEEIGRGVDGLDLDRPRRAGGLHLDGENSGEVV